MGFESFRVELRGGAATHAQAEAAVFRLPGAKPDPDALATRGSTYYTVEDGSHVIEVEVATSPVRVSCRFTLCHPPSVNSAFLALVRALMTGLEMQATICDDVPPLVERPYPVVQFREFAEAASGCIFARRAEWIANFGPFQFPAKTDEVYERVVLPQCVPVAG